MRGGGLDEIPQSIKDFLFRHVHSHEELEVLVFLHRHGGERLSEQDIAEASKIAITVVRDAIKPLGERGIVESLTGDPPARYVTNANYKDELDELIALYEQHRLEIVMLMSANAIERVRTGAMRTFADCFFVGRKRNDG